MQLIKRAVLALTFILALLAVPAVADDGIFIEPPIPEGINQGFMITECGKILIIGVAVFIGPDDDQGKLLIVVRPAAATESQGDVIMSEILADAVLNYKANGQVIELAEITDRFCA